MWDFTNALSVNVPFRDADDYTFFGHLCKNDFHLSLGGCECKCAIPGGSVHEYASSPSITASLLYEEDHDYLEQLETTRILLKTTGGLYTRGHLWPSGHRAMGDQ